MLLFLPWQDEFYRLQAKKVQQQLRQQDEVASSKQQQQQHLTQLQQSEQEGQSGPVRPEMCTAVETGSLLPNKHAGQFRGSGHDGSESLKGVGCAARGSQGTGDKKIAAKMVAGGATVMTGTAPGSFSAASEPQQHQQPQHPPSQTPAAHSGPAASHSNAHLGAKLSPNSETSNSTEATAPAPDTHQSQATQVQPSTFSGSSNRSGITASRVAHSWGLFIYFVAAVVLSQRKRLMEECWDAGACNMV